MPRLLSAPDIGARALRAIGAFPVTETAPDGEHLREALYWLGLIVDELVGTERLFSRIDQAVSFEITNGTGTYELYAALGDDLPEDGIQFVVDAWIEDAAGNRYPIEIVTREKFDGARAGETGRPCWIHIDRLEHEDRAAPESPRLRIHPVPAVADPTAWTLWLSGQQFAPAVAPTEAVSGTPREATSHRLGSAWQRWLVLRLAHDLGSGPITKIGEQSLARFAAGAERAERRLLAFNNREHETTPPVCDAWGM